MKYIITRSSSCDKEEPVEGCTIEEIHEYVRWYRDIKNKPQLWEAANEMCRDLIEEEDLYRGVRKNPTQVFVMNVDDLHEFVKQYGEIILFKPNNEEGLWKIEIYDGYRE